MLDIGDDDSRFDKLREASAAVSAKMRENPDRIPSYVLIALDRDAPPEDTVFGDVHEAISPVCVTTRDLWGRSSHASFRLVSRIPFGVRS